MNKPIYQSMNKVERELNNFEEFERKGQYKELLEYSENQQGVEARYWELVSLMWIGRKTELKVKIQEYKHFFIEDYWRSRFLHVRGLYHWGHESYKAQKYYDDAFEIAKNLEYNQGIADYYIYTAHITNNLQEQSNLFEKGHQFVKKSNSKIGLFWVLNHYAWQNSVNGEFERAEEYYSKINELCNENDDDFRRSLMLTNLGIHYSRKGDYDKYLTNSELSYKLAIKTHNGWSIANSLGNIAFIHKKRGELDEALKYLNLQFDKEVKMNRSRVAHVLVTIGEVHEDRGELDEALGMFETALNTFREEGEVALDSFTKCTMLIGNIHQKRGDFTKALRAFEESYETIQDMNNQLLLAEPLYNLISFHSTHNRAKAQEYLDTFNDIYSDLNNVAISTSFKFARAIYMKSSNRLRDKMQSQIHFEELIQQNEMMGLSTLEFIPYLIELLLIEYESSKEEEVYLEIKSQLTNLIANAEEEFRYPEKIQALIIQSQLLQLEGEFRKSDETINQAIEIAENRRLPILQKQGEKVKMEMHAKITELQELLSKNADFADRVKHTRLFSYLKKAQELATVGRN